MSSHPLSPASVPAIQNKPSHVTSLQQGLCALTATEAVARLRAGDITSLDLVEASIARIEEVDSAVNALPITCFDRARDMAPLAVGRLCREPQVAVWPANRGERL